jgi:hypothetical protein
MLILTATNRAMMECAFLCIRSVERYLTKYPQFHFAVEAIPEEYARPASWYKVPSILKHLPAHDFVLWLDADSMIVGDANLRDLLQDKTINLARDHHGPNNGIAAWKNCPEAFYALERMNREYEKWKEGPWFEQHVLMEMEGELQIGYQPKHIFNAYEEDANSETIIRHWPGMLPHDRVPLMLQAYQKLIT